jgi:hypothetical protein
MTEITYVEVAPVTRTHAVLAELGHKITRALLTNGALGVYTILANPERCTKWGTVPESDWRLCDAAEAAPIHTCSPHPIYEYASFEAYQDAAFPNKGRV